MPQKRVIVRVSFELRAEAESAAAYIKWLDDTRIIDDQISDDYVDNTLQFDVLSVEDIP